MAFPQVGLEVVLQIEKFQRDAERYQRALSSIEQRTVQAGKSLQSGFGDAEGMFSGILRALTGYESASESAQVAIEGLNAGIGMLGASFTLVAGTITVASKAVAELVQMGSEAAQLEDIRRTYVALASASGVSAEKLLADLQRVSGGTMDTISLIQTANRALLAGGGQIANELPKLYEIAAAAARATGQNVDYVFTTLVKGIIKGSPLLIDNAEVYVQIGNAVEQYAQSLGKTTEQLTAQERTQATLNAVLAQGSEFVNKIGANTESASQKYAALNVQWKAFSDGVKTLAAPAADYLARSLSGLLLAAQSLVSGMVATTAVIQSLGRNVLNIAGAGELWKEEFRKAFSVLTTGIAPVENVQSSMTGLADAGNQAAETIRDVSAELSKLDAQRAEKLSSLEKQLTQELEDQSIRRARQAEDDARQLRRQLEDMARSSARRRLDIENDYTRNMIDLANRHAQEWRDLERDAAIRREEMERQHQDRLLDIRRRAQDTITEAARRNDAVEVARAMRERERNIRDEQIDNMREQREFAINEDIKRQKLVESQAQQRAELQLNYQQRLADLIASEAEQQEQLRISLQRQAEDRAIAWARQDEDFQRQKARRLADIDDWYAKEQEKLGIHLDTQTAIAVEKINSGSEQIAEAASSAMQRIAETVNEQITQRGNYLGGYTVPETTAAWRNRHRYFAEGGTILADRPTTITMGEAGRELGIFIPERKLQLALTGRASIGFDGLPHGLSATQVQDLIYRSIARLIETSIGG